MALFDRQPADIEVLRRRLGFVSRDRQEDRRLEAHLGIVRYGNEKLDRWAACPCAANPREIAKYISWLEPQSVFLDTTVKQVKVGNRRGRSTMRKLLMLALMALT